MYPAWIDSGLLDCGITRSEQKSEGGLLLSSVCDVGLITLHDRSLI